MAVVFVRAAHSRHTSPLPGWSSRPNRSLDKLLYAGHAVAADFADVVRVAGLQKDPEDTRSLINLPTAA
jgi:hypothetical protein